MDHRLNKRCTLEHIVDGNNLKYNNSVVLNNERALIEEYAEADAHLEKTGPTSDNIEASGSVSSGVCCVACEHIEAVSPVPLFQTFWLDTVCIDQNNIGDGLRATSAITGTSEPACSLVRACDFEEDAC